MNIAIIGATDMARLVATKAHALGHITHCFAWEEGASAKDAVDYFYPISIFEKDRILSICREIPVQAVLSSTELTIPVANYIATSMGLPSNPSETAENITNKYWQREKCKTACNMLQPWYHRIVSMEELNTLPDIPYPVILKPADEGGKRGIEVAYCNTELSEKAKLTFQADRRGKGIILEQLLPGEQEYSVEGLSYAGKHQIIQITKKISSGPPHCVELGHSQPPALTETMFLKIVSAVKEVLDLVCIRFGPTHTEVKIVDGEVYLIEINARLGGDHISHPLTLLSTGYDYLAEVIKASLGIKPSERKEGTSVRCSGVRFITEQTKWLKPVFDHCDNAEWLYEKHVEQDELTELSHNDCYHTNYLIYCAEKVPEELQQPLRHE